MMWHVGRLWFYYFGSKFRSEPKDYVPDPADPNGGVLLATLRRDGSDCVADANVAYLAVFFFRLHRPSANASSQLFGNHTACDEGVSPNGLLVVLHRFMSVGGEGTLLTQSFISPSPHLFVNADCSGGGSLELELCDAATHAVVATSATALSGDSPRVMVPLSWADESDGVGRQLQLRVVLRGGARLFSWWFESQPTVLDRLGD